VNCRGRHERFATPAITPLLAGATIAPASVGLDAASLHRRHLSRESAGAEERNADDASQICMGSVDVPGC
jgi:hypothetical protein